jgi:hypothetical protein
MSAKMAEARKRAFLAALEATGNVTLAAEAAKVSRSWVLLHRKENATFEYACRDAVAAAKKRLRAHPERRPPSGWGSRAGCERVVRGPGGSGGGKRVQIARARLHQITPRIEDRFLQVLEATCNVDAPASAVGMTASPFYAHRDRWPAFRRRWDEAEKMAALRLTIGLVEHGCSMFSSTGMPPAIDWPRMGCDEMLHNLYMHQHAVDGIGKAPGRTRENDYEGARRKIIAAIDAIQAAKAVPPAVKAKDREEWARRRRRDGDSQE